MMDEAIKNFPKQFAYEPKIKNSAEFSRFTKFVVVGMGGSHLAADLLKVWDPYLDMIIYQDYGLPTLSAEELKQCLIVLSSYSGNTEEVLDAFERAREKKLAIVAVAVGGKLLELAKKYNLPYIQMPDTGIQPRSALGFSFKAFLKIIGNEEALQATKKLTISLKPDDVKKAGEALAKRLKGFVPVIYSSRQNLAIAYNWKIKLNETGKIPAFYNIFSELNHNEMTGFDAQESTKELAQKFYFLLLKDANDNLPTKKRMTILEKLYQDRGLNIESIEMTGKNIFHKIFSSLLLADWAAYYTAKEYGVEAEQVPMVEEFKKLMKE